jgi:hypothetical protein
VYFVQFNRSPTVTEDKLSLCVFVRRFTLLERLKVKGTGVVLSYQFLVLYRGTQKAYITWKITTEIPGVRRITDIRKEYITRG